MISAMVRSGAGCCDEPRILPFQAILSGPKFENHLRRLAKVLPPWNQYLPLGASCVDIHHQFGMDLESTRVMTLYMVVEPDPPALRQGLEPDPPMHHPFGMDLESIRVMTLYMLVEPDPPALRHGHGSGARSPRLR